MVKSSDSLSPSSSTQSLSDDTQPLALATRVLEIEGQGILRCAERLRSSSQSSQAFEKAIVILRSSLEQGGKIIVTGVGKSGKIAQKIAATLSSTGSSSVYLHPTEGLHGDLGIAASGDAVLALSYTGNTDETVRLIPSLKNLKIPVIALGGNPRSQLAEQSDVWLDGFVEQEACPHNLTPTASTTLALALGDALAITLMQLRGFDAKGFAKNHPGGALGSRLNLTVSALMHAGDQLPWTHPAAAMSEVVVILTQKKMGAVLVAEDAEKAQKEGRKLLGMITDGDLRRALQHREKFFDLKAADVMTGKPVVARTTQMVKEALELMENRPSQIAVLPVLDEHDFCVGILRLHDIVRTL